MRTTDIRTGDTFGLWTVIRRSENSVYRERRFLCKCACGKKKVVYVSSLIAGTSKGCATCSHITHGKSRTRAYHIWQGMIQRCHNANNCAYPDYGGRGIYVHEAWRAPRKGFATFYAYIGDPPDGKERWSIDRLDSNGNYEPGNVRWATAIQQAANRRSPKKWSARRRNEFVPTETEYRLACETFEMLRTIPDTYAPF